MGRLLPVTVFIASSGNMFARPWPLAHLLPTNALAHTIRHTTGTHLLRAGVDINTIRAWLGHVSIDTTNIYVEVDLERKAQMLEKTNALRSNPVSKRPWKENPSLMAFLRSL